MGDRIRFWVASFLEKDSGSAAMGAAGHFRLVRTCNTPGGIGPKPQNLTFRGSDSSEQPFFWGIGGHCKQRHKKAA